MTSFLHSPSIVPPSRTRRSVRWTSAVLVFTVTTAVTASACGGGVTDADPAPSAVSDEGADLYRSSCSSCHGTDLRGTDQGPSHLSILYEPGHHGDNSFRSAIVNGAPQHHWNFGDMAAVPGLADDQIDAIIAFVRAEQEREGFER